MGLESQGAGPSEDTLPAVELFNRVRKQVHKPRGSSAVAKAKADARQQAERMAQRIGDTAARPTRLAGPCGPPTQRFKIMPGALRVERTQTPPPEPLRLKRAAGGF